MSLSCVCGAMFSFAALVSESKSRKAMHSELVLFKIPVTNKTSEHVWVLFYKPVTVIAILTSGLLKEWFNRGRKKKCTSSYQSRL